MLRDNDLTYRLPYLDDRMILEMTDDTDIGEYIMDNYLEMLTLEHIVQIPEM